MTKEETKAYKKAWYEAHKESEKAKNKAYYEANKEEAKAKMKAWKEANKESEKAKKKAYYQEHKEEIKAKKKVYEQVNKERRREYKRIDLNSLGETKNNIRIKSYRILKKMNMHIPGYEIHHCFGYEYPTKFIYISKSLHLKIHQYLRDNNIDVDSNHWLHIRDMVLHCNEYFYAKI